MELKVGQQIFILFYAIFFGVMLQTLGDRRTPKDKKHNTRKRNEVTLNLFDTPNAWAIGISKTNRPFFRLILSVFILNVAPGVYFAWIFLGLSKADYFPNLWQIISLVWISLAPQHIYRCFYAILTKDRIRKFLYLSENEHKGYNDHDVDAVALLWTERDQFNAHKYWLNHLAFPVGFYFPTVIILCNYVLVPKHLDIRLVGFTLAWMISCIWIFIIKNYNKKIRL